MKSKLFEKFNVTETGITLADPNITQEEFVEAALEYVKLVSRRAFKQGDLLNLFRNQGWDPNKELIPKLAAKTPDTKLKTFQNQMSVAKHSLKYERSDKISWAHYEALQSLKSPQACGKLIRNLIDERDKGRPITLQRFRPMVKKAKIANGQTINRKGPSRKKA
jgi:hypothetical protein